MLHLKIHSVVLIFSSMMFIINGCSSNQKNEELAYGHFKMGVSYLQKDQKEEALDHLRKARDLDSTNPQILNQLGLTYFFLGEYEQAILTFQEAVKIKPEFTEARNNLARAMIEVGDHKGARQQLDLAIQDLTYPNKDKVWLNFGLSFFKDGDFNQAGKNFLKSIEFNRNNCLAYNYLGRSFLEKKLYSRASKAFDQAIFHCQKQGFDEPHYFGAVTLFRLGYKSQALARLKEAKKLFPNGENRQKIEVMMNLMQVTDHQ